MFASAGPLAYSDCATMNHFGTVIVKYNILQALIVTTLISKYNLGVSIVAGQATPV